MANTALPSRASIAGRLDELPFTRRHLRLLTGSGVGWKGLLRGRGLAGLGFINASMRPIGEA